ncbi:hypothetical protein DP49_6012 [Burkholderia pseudomallei]|nr:hypothetical protein DP49_6012 [Burkholderia pseudomallei]KOT05504.1 hypothetical protein DM77_2759 [Burkholderia mallei]
MPDIVTSPSGTRRYRMTFSLFRKRNTLSSPKFHPISIASQWHSRLAHQTRKGGQIAHYLTNPV